MYSQKENRKGLSNGALLLKYKTQPNFRERKHTMTEKDFDNQNESKNPEQDENSEKSCDNQVTETSVPEEAGCSSNTDQSPEQGEAPAADSGVNRNESYSYAWNGDSMVRKKTRKTKKIVALIVAVTLLLTALALAAGVAASRNDNESGAGLPGASSSVSSGHNINVSATSVEGTEKQTLSALYEKCSVSCVTVYVKKNGGAAFGSGFVINADGYIVTNHHVISGALETTVKFYDGTDYTAEIVGSDSLTDIAVLKINAKDLTAIELGDSNQLSIGDQVFAIGTPYDISLAGTLTSGYISGLNRKFDITNAYGNVTKTMTLIQTDTPINSGNSGGPLINMYGQVVGINTLKLVNNYDNIGFSIPITNAIPIINDILDDGVVSDETNDFVVAPAKLNITVTNINDAVKKSYYLPENVPEGVLITAMARGTAIYKAGVDPYDIITEFNGTAITSIDDLSKVLSDTSAGKSASIKVFRPSRNGTGEYLEFTFTLDAAS